MKTFCPTHTKLLVCGSFNLIGNESGMYHVDDVVSYSSIIENDNRKNCPIYIGGEIKACMLYEINSSLKSWKMNEKLHKTPKAYCFIAYLFIESTNPDYYLCVASIVSPPFNIVSARRSCIDKYIKVKIPSPPRILCQPPFSPVNYKIDNERNNFKESDSSYMIKSKKDPNIFKFDDLMPHIYDEDELKSCNNNSNMEINDDKVIEREVESVEGMKEVVNDIILSERNIVYRVSSKIGRVEVRAFNQTNNNSKREEISYFGGILNDLNEKYEYLDSLGNRCVMTGAFKTKNNEEVYN